MLFSERYADLIGTESGQMVDNICGELDYNLKVRLSDVMRDFAEPQKIYPDRYSSYDITTTALEMAVDNFNEIKGVPYISLKHNVFDGPMYDPLANAFTPFLFDVIELQYQKLSSGEKVDFQAEINTAFTQYNAPWLLCEGRMVKIDATQFELDLRQKTLEIMGELKGSDLKFQAAYEELLQACESFEKDDFTDRTELLNSKKYFTNVRKWFAQSYPSPEGKSDAVIYLAEKSLVQYLPYAMEALDL